MLENVLTSFGPIKNHISNESSARSAKLQVIVFLKTFTKFFRLIYKGIKSQILRPWEAIASVLFLMLILLGFY